MNEYGPVHVRKGLRGGGIEFITPQPPRTCPRAVSVVTPTLNADIRFYASSDRSHAATRAIGGAAFVPRLAHATIASRMWSTTHRRCNAAGSMALLLVLLLDGEDLPACLPHGPRPPLFWSRADFCLGRTLPDWAAADNVMVTRVTGPLQRCQASRQGVTRRRLSNLRAHPPCGLDASRSCGHSSHRLRKCTSWTAPAHSPCQTQKPP